MSEIRDDMKVCPYCGFALEQARKEFGLYPDRLVSETILGGRYILGRLLSATDYSMIYLAWDALLEMRVAIREYFPAMFAYREAPEPDIRFFAPEAQGLFEIGRQAFETEAQKLFLIQSLPEVPDYYRVIREFNTSYIVMEYLEGITLEEYVASKKRIQGLSYGAILEHIRCGLDRLHKKGVLHLNLSPDNIYLCDHDRICLIDEGSAKAVFYRLAKCEPDLYQELFIAPEVVAGKNGSRASDLYSLGCVMYFLSTGFPPSRGNLRSLKGMKDKKSASAQMIRRLTRPKPEDRMDNSNSR